jgi:hypothetical protein
MRSGDVARPIPKTGPEAMDGGVLDFHPAQNHLLGLLRACPAKTKSPIQSFSRWRRITTGLHENTKDVRLSPDYSQGPKRECKSSTSNHKSII